MTARLASIWFSLAGSGPGRVVVGKPLELRIVLMGQFRLFYGETAVPIESPNYQSILAYLVLHASKIHSRHQLAFQFWSESTENQALTNLRKAIHYLRHTLPEVAQFLQVDRHTLTWREDSPYSLDVVDFETAVTQARQAHQKNAKAAALQKAISCYLGDLLPDQYNDWILERREILRQQYLACLDEQVQLLEGQRAYGAAIEVATQLVRADPLHEVAHRRLMRLQILNGNRAGALRTYHSCATLLQRELGVSPSPNTQEAYHRILALETAVTAAPPLPSIPLIGRTDDWLVLQKAWKHAAHNRPAFVLIKGEAGIGKTRLAEELLDWSARQGIMTVQAACYAPVNSVPFGPLTDCLRGGNFPKYLAGLADKWLLEVSRILPEILADRSDLTPPLPISQSWQRQHLYTALAQAFLQLPQPFLLFLDDLQWCDPDTLVWLQFLLHFDAQARFLLVGTVRQDSVGDEHPLASFCRELQREDCLKEVTLNRLDLAETTTLSEQIIGQAVAAAQAERLFVETEGVPLFIVEMARTGLPFLEKNSQAESGTAAILPPKMQAVLAQRLADLSPTAQALAGLAAMIGRFFTFDLLAVASGEPEITVVRGVDELWRKRIVREQGSDRYDFSHEKLRQLFLASLSMARQRLWHKRIIAALEAERMAGKTIDEGQLGQHYVAVGQIKAAIACYERVAQKAAQLFTHGEALANLDRALALAVQIGLAGEMALALPETRGDVLMLLGRYDEARAAWQTAVCHTANPIDHARLLRKQGDAWTAQQQHAAAGEAYDHALNLLESAPVEAAANWWSIWLDVQLCRGNVFYFSAQLPTMAALIAQLREAVAQHGELDQQSRLLDLENMLVFRQKRYRLNGEDVARTRRIYALAVSSSDGHRLAAAQFALGFATLWSGSPEIAAQEISAALRQATEVSHLYLQDQCLAYLTLAYRRRGAVAQVQALVGQHRPIAAQTGNPFYQGILAGNEAWLAAKEGAWATAVAHAEAALAAWGPLPFPLQWVALWPLLAAHVVLADLATAVDCAVKLLAPSQQSLDEGITAVLEQSVAAWDGGETAVCHHHLTTALNLAQSAHTF